MPGLENSTLNSSRTNSYFASLTDILYEIKKLLKYVFSANKIVCVQSDSNTQPLNQNANEAINYGAIKETSASLVLQASTMQHK
jgi:hypothetical protein